MRSGARRGRGSRFPEGRGRRALVAPPQNGCSGRACAAARAGGVVRVSRRGRARGRGGPGELCEGTAGRGGSGELCKRAQRGGGSGELCERAQRGGGPAGLCKRAQGTAARRVAAVPVCPPFRDRSRGGREVGAAPPVAGGCCEAGLHRCGWRGAAVPGDCARGRRGRRPGGWLPCRFVRHFVTGRGVAVKWGLRRRSPGVVVKRGCTAVDGGARRFRGIMQEGAEGRWPGGLCERTAGRGGPAGGCRAGLPAIS